MWLKIFLVGGQLMILLLQLSYHELAHAQSTHGVSHAQKNSTATSTIESRTGYFCTDDGIRIKSRKDRQQRRCRDFVEKVQKKICEQIFSSIKMRLRIKEFNIDNPYND